MLRLLIAVVLLLASGCATRDRGTEGDLLAGRAPAQAVLADRALNLTDGIVATRSDDWRSNVAAVLRSPHAFVEYDLGRRVAITAAYLQADANDFYTLTVSDDGTHFTPLWRAKPANETGLQPRWAEGLKAHGRYLRLSANGGDGRFSVTEVAVYEHTPRTFPPHFTERRVAPPPEALRTATLVLGLALVLFVVLAMQMAQWWATAFAALMPLLAGVRWFIALFAAWPVQPREVSLVRGVVAAVAAVVVVCEVFAPSSWRKNRRVVIYALAASGALAAACFANLGRAQYVDHEHHAPGYVHNFDMRVYFPVAKYFRELSFDGLYDASVAAYVDDDPTVSLQSLHEVPLRDLRSHAMVHVSDLATRIEGVKTRFSPDRWREFVADMRYFRRNMGTHDYLGSMSDHGGNATPAWFVIPHLLFSHLRASNATLLGAALLDPLLLVLAFIAIARTFGLRTMLVALVVFGANDFYMFGTDWFGSTLRQDWLAYLALGVCALKTGRYKLGGGLFGMSAMMRAFPAAALVGSAIPAGWWFYSETVRQRRLPRFSDLLREHRPTVQVVASALAVALGMFVLSSILFSPSSWVAWFHKVTMLDSSPHLNQVSLRGLLAGSGGPEARLLLERMPIFIAGIVAFLTLIVIAARRRPLHQAALLGLPLVFLVFNPANYYSHLVFLYPLLAVELPGDRTSPDWVPVSRRDAGIWVVLLGLCALQYATVLVHDTPLHFQLASALLFVALAIVLVMLVVPQAGAGAVAFAGVAVTASGAAAVTLPEAEAPTHEEAASETAEDAPEQASAASDPPPDSPREAPEDAPSEPAEDAATTPNSDPTEPSAGS